MQKLLKLSALSSRHIAGGLLLLYLISTAFLELPLYAAWQHRLQLPELIFVLSCPLLIFTLYRSRHSFALNRLDLAVGLYLLINVCSALWNHQASPWLEVLGKSYLVGVYLLFRLGVQNQQIDQKDMIPAFKLMIAAIFLMISTGYVMLYFGKENVFLARFADYPYLGTVYRAKALLQTPSMYISIVNWCIIYLLANSLQKGNIYRSLLQLLLFGMIALFSFSKALLLTGFAVLLIFVFHYRQQAIRKVWLPVMIVFGLLYFLFTNFVFLKPGNGGEVGSTYLAVNEIQQDDQGSLIPTAYFSLKKAAIGMGLDAPFLGVGPGCFINQLQVKQQTGAYPSHLPLHDPHSVYLGAWAETGSVGLLGLLTLLAAVFGRIRKISTNDPFYQIFLVWLLLFLLEGMNTDLMNFRHYWIQLGLIGGWPYLNRS
ncbi:MAG: O-antigen ligase family protein [Saprospiraceae bacterium]|nr:O-antigen ligase family protein [Lewinella sp.]